MVMSKKISRRQLVILSIIAVFVIALLYIIYYYGQETTDDASIDANVVAISAKVSGYIKKIYVTDNQLVKAGDIILEIEATDYEVIKSKAEASLKSANAKLQAAVQNLETIKISAPSNLESAESQLKIAVSEWEKSAADLKRFLSLNDSALSKQQLDEVVALEKAAASRVDDAKARLKTAQTVEQTIAIAQYSVTQLAAEVERIESELAEAKNNLSYTKVFAPFHGKITKRGIENGSYVQPGQQLLSVVSQNFWVVANFKENQIVKMKPGQKVDITIDAYPDKKFKGVVDSIQSGTGARFSIFPPENATGNFVKIVQRVPVKIMFNPTPDPSLSLGPGMSVIPVVHVR